MRAYTVPEIDALRYACTLRWLYGTTNLPQVAFSRNYCDNEKYRGVEEMVRTHMIAGHTADDLKKADLQK
jgi:hypothetical protein